MLIIFPINWERKELINMAKTSSNELVRVNMNLPSTIVNQVKEYADDLGINVTSAYIVLLNQALDQKTMMGKLPMLLNILNGMQISAQQFKEAQEILEVVQAENGKEEKK